MHKPLLGLAAGFLALALAPSFEARGQAAPIPRANDNADDVPSTARMLETIARRAPLATITHPGAGAVPVSVAAKLALAPVDTADFGIACQGHDERAKMQAAIDAVPLGGELRVSCGGPIGLSPADGTTALYVRKPIRISCVRGSSFRPLPSMGETINVLHLYGHPAGNYLPTIIDGCAIGDLAQGTRHGAHAIVFDTRAAGQVFVNTKVRQSYIQQSAGQAGRGIVAINDPAVNPVGGLHNATLCEDSIVQGGVSLNDVGDSIVLKNCTFTGRNDVYVNLVHAKGGIAGNFVIDGGPIATAGGLVIDCAASAQITNVVAEQSQVTTSASASLIDVRGATCRVNNVTVRGGQVQSDPGMRLSQLVRVHNAIGTVIDDMRLATPTPFTPLAITAEATETLYGAGNTIVGGGKVVDRGKATRRTVTLPFAIGTVVAGEADTCGRGYRCLRIPN